jgi:predicted enzyme related to lactoylglutathione lyase
MTMPDKTIRGRFVWHELMTSNITHAHNFYGKVIGWKTQPFDQDPSYQMFAANSGPIGGTVRREDGPGSWLPFIGTTDIETTIGDATQLDATIVTKPDLTPGGSGKWAILKDPQGATFAIYQSLSPDAAEKPPKRGEFSWHELATTDYKAAFDFYSKLFGWEVSSEVDMGPLGLYFMFGRNGVPIGGMFVKPPEMKGDPNWCGYIRVKDIDKVVSKAKASGATLINGPSEVPGGDWVAQFIDPQGALFAVHALKADVAPTRLHAADASAPEQGALDFSVPPQTSQRVAALSKTQSAPSKTKVKKSKPVAKTAPPQKAKKVAQRAAATPPPKNGAAKKKKTVQRLAKKTAVRKVAKKAAQGKAAKKKLSKKTALKKKSR